MAFTVHFKMRTGINCSKTYQETISPMKNGVRFKRLSRRLHTGSAGARAGGRAHSGADAGIRSERAFYPSYAPFAAPREKEQIPLAHYRRKGRSGRRAVGAARPFRGGCKALRLFALQFGLLRPVGFE